ncbi:FAD-binding oxidoreductase [Stakelama tenebrarum]|uniref:FAD-binding oxidoreductase n=1 Tax=Stakelama tenebrarum TaxID=2711215 RepID=A0A6G6Y5H7_9SPHN|nr:FAD-binding oxidoreductase [Sphingosinithalassobacter tenebrarum]QIG80160.1 FAD-binding oxidoreductase [Sphingosinithalassobacter tenebrarum]
MSRPGAAAAELRAALGDTNLLCDAGDLASYAADGRGARGTPAMVARPASTAEVAETLRIAFAHGLSVVPQGAATGLVAAGIAGDGEEQLLLSLDRLNAAPQIDAANRTAEVEAGVLLSTLNAAAEPHGLGFPIDLGADPSIGGMIAANTGGARFLRYGDVRRNLLGLELVTAESEPRTLTLGAPVWKDNSGLALKHLAVGSSGALGIVTRASLALSRLPAARISALISLLRAEAALPLLERMEAQFDTLLTAFEGISQAAIAAALGHVPRLRNPFPDGAPPYAVLVELSGGRCVAAEWLQERLTDILAPMLEDGVITDAAFDDGGDLWAIRHAVPEGLRASGKVMACDICLRRGDMMAFRAEMIARLTKSEPRLKLHDFGHIGDGGMHFNMVWPESSGAFDPDAAEAARAMILRAVTQEYGGSFSAEHGVGPANARWYAEFTSPEIRTLAGKVQDLLAPMPLGRVDFGMPQTRNAE